MYKISNIHFDPYKLITTRYYDYYEIEISNFKFITTIVAGGLTVFEKRKKREKEKKKRCLAGVHARNGRFKMSS